MYQLSSLMEEKLSKLSYATFSYDSDENEVEAELNSIKTRIVHYNHLGSVIYVDINDRFTKRIEDFIKDIESGNVSAKNLQDKFHYERTIYSNNEYRVNNRILASTISHNNLILVELKKLIEMHKGK